MLHQTRIVFPRQVEADNGEQIALDAQVYGETASQAEAHQAQKLSKALG